MNPCHIFYRVVKRFQSLMPGLSPLSPTFSETFYDSVQLEIGSDSEELRKDSIFKWEGLSPGESKKLFDLEKVKVLNFSWFDDLRLI